jgi:hypothetical protein
VLAGAAWRGIQEQRGGGGTGKSSHPIYLRNFYTCPSATAVTNDLNAIVLLLLLLKQSITDVHKICGY